MIAIYPILARTENDTRSSIARYALVDVYVKGNFKISHASSLLFQKWPGPNVELHMRRTKLQIGSTQMGKGRPLGQTSKIIHRTKFRATKYTLSYKFLIYSLSSIHEKIDVCPTVDLHTFYPSEADG